MTTPERAFHRLGRRGVLLALFGAYWALYGASFFTAPPYRFGHMGTEIGHVLNSHWLGWVWVCCGAVAVAVALQPRWRSDTLGFVALIIPSSVWAFLWLLSWSLSVLTDEFGEARAWVSTGSWFALAAVVAVCASWPDPEETHQ